MVACQFARAGIAVTLIEAGRAGESAALDAGWIVETPGVWFREIQDRRGKRAARHVFEVSRRSALDVTAFLRRPGGPVDLEARDAIQLATSRTQAALEREQQARADAGLDAAWLPGKRAMTDTRVDEASGALKTGNGGLADPLRVCRRLLAAAAGAGARIVDRTEVTRLRPLRKDIEVVTKAARVRAQAVVVATGMPRPLVPALQRHVRVDDTYVVATPALPPSVARRLPSTAIVRDVVPPDRLPGLPPIAYDMSVALTARRRVILQGGTQAAVADRLRDRTLVQRTGQLMYELSLRYPVISGIMPEYAWTARRVTGRDGLPVIGSHRGFPRHLFAVGLGGLGLTGAWLAARLLLRQYTGAAEPGDEHFGFGRFS